MVGDEEALGGVREALDEAGNGWRRVRRGEKEKKEAEEGREDGPRSCTASRRASSCVCLSERMEHAESARKRA